MATGISFSDYSASTCVINGILRNTAYTPVATIYVALFTVSPTDSTAGTEVSGGSYARQSITFSAPAGSPRSTSNSGTISFPAATANWGTIVAVAIMDASTSGNMLFYGAMSSSQTVNSGGTISFAATGVSLTID